MTLAERAFWRLLRDRRLAHLKFRRQVPLGPYVVDFACYALRLVIELDGGIHNLTEARDAQRDPRLSDLGWTVARFRNDAALTNPNLIIDAIRRYRPHLS